MVLKFSNFCKIVFINIIILYCLLYLLEIGINFKNETLFKKTRLHYLNFEKKKKPLEKFNLNFSPYKFLSKKYELLPLSGFANENILLCLNEKNKPIYYFSDKNGFRNNLKNNNKNIIYDYLLIGDSYVQGLCVDNNNYLNAQFKKFNLDVASLGVQGNGPLLEYASFREYHNQYLSKNLILFLTIENDFYDLYNEKENQILLNYLKDKNFNQNITSDKNKNLKKKLINSYLGKTTTFFGDFISVYHFNLKQIAKIISNIFIKSNSSDKDIYLFTLQDKKTESFFFKILSEFQLETQKKNMNFYIVFNGITPNFLFPNNYEEKKLNLIFLDKLKVFKTYLKSKNIQYYDFNEFLLKNHNRQDISNIYKKVDKNWDHYNENGYFILTKELISTILQIKK